MASLARTILEEHLTRGELVPGQEIAISVDQTLVQDATGTMAMMQFELFGHDRVEVDRKSTRLNSSHQSTSRMPSSA